MIKLLAITAVAAIAGIVLFKPRVQAKSQDWIVAGPNRQRLYVHAGTQTVH